MPNGVEWLTDFGFMLIINSMKGICFSAGLKAKTLHKEKQNDVQGGYPLSRFCLKVTLIVGSIDKLSLLWEFNVLKIGIISSGEALNLA
ncbi:MAG: hypothetical protein JXI33_07740 [Candidatus Aminicenantes bacterium]|nr:hypothetical protein [Candidatus Aminicenantes bacterium]